MRNLIIFLLTITSFQAISQITLSGFIDDSATKERIVGANLFIKNLNIGATTNNFGFYAFNFNHSDSITIIVSFIGYQTHVEKLFVGKSEQKNISLTQGIHLKEVNIVASSAKLSEPRMSILELPMKQIAFLPKLAGETDIMRVFQLMPGVQMGKEGTSGIYVRGGSPDQNLILLDDVPMYYVNHIGGFISVFNPNAINSATLYKGGFPARYGSRLSSILDVRMKEGNMNEVKGNFTFGILSSKLTLEFPVKQGKTSAIISIRRSLFDLITRGYFLLLNPASKQSAGYTIYDLNAKINHKISEKDHLYFSVYSGRDRLFSNQRDFESYDNRFIYNSKRHTQWGNIVVSGRWNHIYTNQLFGNITFGYTHFYYDITATANKYVKVNKEKVGVANTGFNSNVSDGIFKADYDYYPSNKNHIKFGGSFIIHKYNPSANYNKQTDNNVTLSDTIIKTNPIKALELSLYAEDELKVTDNISINAGIRLSGFKVHQKFYFSPEPRFTANYILNPSLSLKASYAYMTQPIHLLSNSGAGLPADLWVPSTENIKPENSHQIAIGIANKLPGKSGLDLTFEAFYKTMDNLIDFREGMSFFSGKGDWQSKIECGGKGKVYGLEILIEKKTGSTTGWIGYTLSKNLRQFSNINSGNPYPYMYDRTHDISVVLNHQFDDHFAVSAIWVFSTGNAITIPNKKNLVSAITFYDLSMPVSGSYFSESHIYPGKNNYRMPTYHRLDLSCSFTRHIGQRTKVWSIDIYNAYSRLNPFYLYFDKNEAGEVKLYSFSLFPIIPSFSYSYSF